LNRPRKRPPRSLKDRDLLGLAHKLAADHGAEPALAKLLLPLLPELPTNAPLLSNPYSENSGVHEGENQIAGRDLAKVKKRRSAPWGMPRFVGTKSRRLKIVPFTTMSCRQSER
jgi:hypothetical protein